MKVSKIKKFKILYKLYNFNLKNPRSQKITFNREV